MWHLATTCKHEGGGRGGGGPLELDEAEGRRAGRQRYLLSLPGVAVAVDVNLNLVGLLLLLL
jgi:hypothetical protein